MSTKLAQIEEYLSYYYRLPVAPQYAILIRGNWGSGKSWFIEQSIRKYEDAEAAASPNPSKKARRALYVSLYGLSNTKEIENEFFRQLHPVLSSKGMGIAGKILKGALKTGLNVDWNGDGKTDATVSVSVPDLDLPGYLKNTSGLVLVFDDVERCSIPICDLMGYINYYVEHDGYKAILVANEEEILKRDAEVGNPGNEYNRIKEKLIGKTFEIESDVSSAIESFLEGLQSGRAEDFLRKNIELIIEIHNSSGYANLRHLRQIFLDFERIVGLLPDQAKYHDELLADLLKTFIVFSIEFKSGAVTAEDVSSLMNFGYRVSNLKGSEKSEELSNLLSKYKSFSALNTVLPSEVLSEILVSGLIDKAALEKAVLNSRYFAKENAEEWMLLWDVYSLSDAEVDTYLQAVYRKFMEGGYKQLGVLLHVCSTLLELSSLGVHPESADLIIEHTKNLIDALADSGELLQSKSFFDDRSPSGWGGLGWRAPDAAVFNAVLKHAQTKMTEAAEKSYPSEALSLISVMETDTSKFVKHLTVSNEGGQFYNVPVLAFMDAQMFVDRVCALHPKKFQYLPGVFKERYSFESVRPSLSREYGWLVKVAKLLEAEIAKRNSKVSGFLLGHLRKSLLSAAQNLRPVKLMKWTPVPKSKFLALGASV